MLNRLDLTYYIHAVVLCNSDRNPQQADAQTLVTLLHVRDICDRLQHPCQIVTEILDVRNQALAQVARPDDFVISEQLISVMLGQVAEQKSLNAVLTDLFSPEGSEIYLKSAHDYIILDRPVNFYTVLVHRFENDSIKAIVAHGVVFALLFGRVFALVDVTIRLGRKFTYYYGWKIQYDGVGKWEM